MQNVPDSLTGFQPDMDPDLREVLEALEVEETIEETSDADDPEDLFAELVKGGQLETQESYNHDDDDDDTITQHDHDITGSEYLTEMAQYKTKVTHDDTDSVLGAGETESIASRASIANTHRTSKQRRKRRQKLGGAYSEAGTDFSMTSSANFRNDGLTTLDDRFEKVPT